MASGNFYMIYINRSEASSYEDVKKKMDLSRDWYRVTERLWILYTTSDSEKWYARLNRLVKDDGSLLICKLDMSDRQGWMSEKFWEWLRKHEPSEPE
ncbi:MAG: hypothetical protein WCF20_12000 [Methylovirgula sp.]